MSKTSWKSKEKYNRQHYRRFNFQIPKEIGDKFAEDCKQRGLPLNFVFKEFCDCWNLQDETITEFIKDLQEIADFAEKQSLK